MTGLRAGLGGLLIGGLALGALASTAAHATGRASQLVAAPQLRRAQSSNKYYACLDAQAHSLVRARDVVFIGEANRSRLALANETMGGWAHLTLDRRHATVALLFGHPTHGGSCAGVGLTSIRHLPSGGVRIVVAGEPQRHS